MAKNKSKKKKSSKPSGPRQYVYISTCHNVQADKPELKASSEWRSDGATKDAGLGKWKCSVCKESCKVARKKAVQENQNEKL